MNTRNIICTTLALLVSMTAMASNWRVDATVNGSGDIDCYASEVLNAYINGSGDVDCNGNPKTQRYDRR